MNNLEFNKAAAAVLVAGIVFMVAGVVASMVVKPTPLAQSVLNIQTASAPAAGAAAKEEPLAPISPLLATADLTAGEAVAKRQCASCHSFNEGGKNGVGPNLYGIIGREHASLAGFNYSNAAKQHKGPWTYEEMSAWLHKPAAFAPGTRMAYAGLKSDKQRADVILYLRSLAATFVPLP